MTTFSACDLHCALDGAVLTVRDAVGGHRLAVIPLDGLMRPWLDGARCTVSAPRLSATADGITVEQDAPGLRLRATLRADGGHLELGGSVQVDAPCQLNRLELLPAGTRLNLWDVVNYRNRHHTHQAWPELLLGGKGCETDTYSTDWQFAPHPSMLILRRDQDHLLLGALDLPTAYGLYLKAVDQRLEHLHLDYGPAPHGQLLAAGTFVFPRFAILLQRGTVEQAIGRWTSLLVAQGAIPDPARKVRHAWHTAPLYCTWIDQCARAVLSPPAELADQAAAVGPAIRVLDQAMVREALAVVKRERLPFRTILLDDGWQIARGQWTAHPQRFPDLRGLVDEIHAAGMKALVWWGWPEIAKDAEVDPAFLIGGGKRNRHGARMYDYASPQVRRDYLEPLFHRLFSSDPGCYDLDGVKTDFMADKVHADMPPGDPAWRGEENFFVRFYACFHALMRRHKPDACHIGCAGHPWLADVTEINRTFDVSGSDVRQHESRGAMLAATSPGTPVALDFHNHVENLNRWFELGRRRGWSFQVGNILSMSRDPLSPWEPADPAFIEQIRRGIGG